MADVVSPAFYESLGADRFRSTERTEGPWSPLLQHGSPPAALLGRALERCEPREGAFISRITFELLGAVPVDELQVHAEVERPGRSVELLKAELSAGGRVAMRATAWRVTASPITAGEPEDAVPPLPPSETAAPPHIAHTGYLRSIEWRSQSGNWVDPGPATVWCRPRVPLLEGEPLTGLQRLLCVVDSASGISATLDWAKWVFINTDLSIHLTREPQGDWIVMDAITRIAEGGAGLATAALGDERGYLGRSAQTLLVRPT